MKDSYNLKFIIFIIKFGNIFLYSIGYIFYVFFRSFANHKVDSSEFKTILATLLLLVGIAIAYDAFFAEKTLEVVNNNGAKTLSPFAKFIKDISINVPVLYGMISILLALVLGVGAAILRRFFSNLRKNKQSVKTK